MGLEAGTYISDLNAANPNNTPDTRSVGDDHLRLIKSVLKNSFPNVNGSCNFTPAEANKLVGIPAANTLAHRDANGIFGHVVGWPTANAGAVNAFPVDLASNNMLYASWLSGAALNINVINRADGRFCSIIYNNTSGGAVTITWVGLAAGALFLPTTAQAAVARSGLNIIEIQVINSVEHITMLNATTLNI